MKSPAILPPRRYHIPNQGFNITINKQDPIIAPLLEKYSTGYKLLFNDTHYSNKEEEYLNDSTDNSRTEIDNFLNKLNVKKDKDKDD